MAWTLEEALGYRTRLTEGIEGLTEAVQQLKSGPVEDMGNALTRIDRILYLAAGALPCEDGIIEAWDQMDWECDENHCSDDSCSCELLCDEAHCDSGYCTPDEDVVLRLDHSAYDRFEAQVVSYSDLADLLEHLVNGPKTEANLGMLVDWLRSGHIEGESSDLETHRWPRTDANVAVPQVSLNGERSHV